jgi:hypothetical protein
LPRKSAAPQQSQKASFRFVFGLRDLCVAAKIGGASTKPESKLSLCIRLARSLTYCNKGHDGKARTEKQIRN